MSTAHIKINENKDEESGWLEIVRRQVGSLRFGVVQIVVHDSHVTQIDKTERVRLEKTKKITDQKSGGCIQTIKRLTGQPEIA